jgi:cysteine synthase A
MDWLAANDTRDITAVALAPDMGERYLDTVYQTNWVQDLFGEDALVLDKPRVGAVARRRSSNGPGQRRRAG